MADVAYPVRVEARPDPELSRGLWLVKWLLAIPHLVVLAVLAIAFWVISVMAFFAILVTGRYPLSLFEFNLGVLRWAWRVSAYIYGVGCTDRYPPFTLEDVPDYPARLEIDYPERLSRGLVLVKWWLLAIPQYLVVGALTSGGALVTWQATEGDWRSESSGAGLIGLLVLIALVGLLFTGRYHRPLFDLIVGLNRWVIRVAAYAALMTDRYPPFGLDQGGSDPAAGPRPPTDSGTGARQPAAVGLQGGPGAAGPVQAPPAQQPQPRHAARFGAGRVVSVVVGSIVALIGLGLLAGGIVLAALGTQRDSGGYLNTSTQRLGTPTAALVSPGMDVGVEGQDWVLTPDRMGTVRITVRSNATQPVFVGIGRESDVTSWLSGTAYDEVDSVGVNPFRVSYLRHGDGTDRVAPPVLQKFWATSATGTGEQTVTWPVQGGTWSIVVANATGTPGVDVQARVGANVPGLGWVALGLGLVGVLLLAVGVLLVVIGVRAPQRAGSQGTT